MDYLLNINCIPDSYAGIIVLNLIINGLPSKPGAHGVGIKFTNGVLNLIINGLPSKPWRYSLY